MNEIIDRVIRGEASPQESAELAAWRQASPDNERQYQEMVALLRALGNVRADAGLGPPPRAAHLIKVMRRRDTERLTRERAGWTPWLPWGVAAAAAVLAITVTWSSTNAPPNSSWQPTEIVTGAGELATVQLGDGSVARLAPRSRLRIVPSRDERLVWLEGQAFFAVARQHDRPFRVRTTGGEALALGTRFEVATNSRGLRLVVLDGRVALSAGQGSDRTEVVGGETAGLIDGRPSRARPISYSSAAVAWMGRFLAFQSTPLPQVAAEIERVYGIRVIVSDTALLGETVSASFTDEPFHEVVGVVCAVIGGRCAISDSVVTIGR